MTIRDLVVRFGFEVDKDSEKEAQNGIKKIKGFAAKLLGTIGIGLSIAGISGLAEAAADAEALRSQFSQVFGEMETEAKRRLQAVADDTGVNANRMMASFSGIAAFAKVSGVQQAQALELSERAMAAVADSAAYYDRSIEEVTESLRSFLKGNFENDAALGLSATETTRNTAANALYGKSFKDLSEAEKQFTLLKMVEDANRASGALGQAARESDTWTNQLGNLKQSLKDLKAAAGGPFLKPAVAVLKLLVSLTQRATKAVEGLTAENGILTRATDRYHGLIKRLQPAADRMTQTFSRGMNRGIEVVKGVVGKLGGVENALKLLAVLAGAFFLAMNWGRIISGAGVFLKIISGIGKMFSSANLKILAVAAVFAALGLLVEDFIQFLLGNDSVIGTVFDKLGIGADNARQMIQDAFENIKGFFVRTWKELKAAVEKHGGSIKQSISKIFGGIITIAGVVFKTLMETAGRAFGGLAMIFTNIDLSTPISAVVSVIDVLIGVLGSLGGFISSHAGLVEILVKAYAAFRIGSVIAQLAKLSAGFAAATAAKVKDAAETIYLYGLYAKDFVIGLRSSAVALASQAKAFAFATAAKMKDKAETLALYAMYAKDFVAGLVKSTAALVKQAAQFAVNTAAKAADTVAQGAMTAATVAWNIAAAAATTATTALGAAIAFLTSPIGLVTLAVGALIAAGVLLYRHWDQVKGFAVSIWGEIVSFFQTVWETIKALFSVGLAVIQAAWNAAWGAVSGFFQGIWNGIVSFLQGAWATITEVISGSVNNAYNTIVSVLTAIHDFFSSTFSAVASFVSSTFTNILSGVTGAVGSIKDTIVNGLNTAVDFIKRLPSQAVQWGADFIGGLKDGILSGVQGVVDAVRGVGEKIRSFLHFSVPDVGPLTDYESWMPDFMNGLARGISENEDTVLDRVRSLAGSIRTLISAATARAATAAAGTVNNSSSSVTQNVNIENSYTGGGADAQRDVPRAMKKSASDATTQMARALAYARG